MDRYCEGVGSVGAWIMSNSNLMGSSVGVVVVTVDDTLGECWVDWRRLRMRLDGSEVGE